MANCLCPLCLRLFAAIFFLMGAIWVAHVGMSYGAITTESAMCTYHANFGCVQRTLAKSTVWEPNFARATFSTTGTAIGECSVTDSSDKWLSLFAFLPNEISNLREDAYIFEGFTPGEATFQAASELECNMQATNLTLAPRACSVESSSFKWGGNKCGAFTSEEVFAFNMKALGAGGLAIFLSLVLCCCAARCAATPKGVVREDFHHMAHGGSNNFHDATPMTHFPPQHEEEMQPLNGHQEMQPKSSGLRGFFAACCSNCSRPGPGPQRTQLPR